MVSAFCFKMTSFTVPSKWDFTCVTCQYVSGRYIQKDWWRSIWFRCLSLPSAATHYWYITIVYVLFMLLVLLSYSPLNNNWPWVYGSNALIKIYQNARVFSFLFIFVLYYYISLPAISPFFTSFSYTFVCIWINVYLPSIVSQRGLSALTYT